MMRSRALQRLDAQLRELSEEAHRFEHQCEEFKALYGAEALERALELHRRGVTLERAFQFVKKRVMWQGEED